jgi:MoaA/NifB/PqqE/SkfB family radical SAM enzyme
MTAIANLAHAIAHENVLRAKAPPARAKAVRHDWTPAVCDVSVTNACNATCEFCCFAYDKNLIKEKRWIDSAEFARALPILHRRGIRYLNFQGGEPLLHPAIQTLVANTCAAGLRPALITNGWLLPRKIQSLIDAGLGTLLVSIDSHSLTAHEGNRGLQGVGERIKAGLKIARQNGIPTIASVTVNRLVNYAELPVLLQELGFDAVDFSCPRRAPLGSSSMVYNSNSTLIDFQDEELLHALDEIKLLKKRFPVQNPTAMLDDVQRHVRGEPERFACVGGYKYFYLDWNLNIWRCEAWGKPLGSVFNLDRIPDCRDHCNACIMSCYRDASVLMHAGVAADDARMALAEGHVGKATRTFFRRTVAQSLGAILEQAPQVLRLAKRRQPEISTRQE